jgi:hypothetical protein
VRSAVLVVVAVAVGRLARKMMKERKERLLGEEGRYL